MKEIKLMVNVLPPPSPNDIKLRHSLKEKTLQMQKIPILGKLGRDSE